MKLVSQKYLPKLFSVELDDDTLDLIRSSKEELKGFAEKAEDKCWGYFFESDRDSLPVTHTLATRLQQIVSDKYDDFEFSFIRWSGKRQRPLVGDNLHLDSNSKTGIGKVDSHVEAWRILINLDEKLKRSVSYSKVMPDSNKIMQDKGLRTSNLKDSDKDSAILEPISGNTAHGLVFCASEVFHGGDDDENGHFLLAFGVDREV